MVAEAEDRLIILFTRSVGKDPLSAPVQDKKARFDNFALGDAFDGAELLYGAPLEAIEVTFLVYGRP